jgi:hypothetical protein
VADDPASDAGVTAGAGLGVVLAAWADVLEVVPAALVAVLAAAVTGLVTVLTTEPTALETEAPAAEPAGAADDAGPVSAETADATAEGAGGGSSPVAAWACLEKSSKTKRIPAAAIANCATRTAARCASSCDIDSSYPRRT